MHQLTFSGSKIQDINRCVVQGVFFCQGVLEKNLHLEQNQSFSPDQTPRIWCPPSSAPAAWSRQFFLGFSAFAEESAGSDFFGQFFFKMNGNPVSLFGRNRKRFHPRKFFYFSRGQVHDEQTVFWQVIRFLFFEASVL